MILFWQIFILSVFVSGTFYLAKFTKFERHFILFLIRTKYLLNLIERIAKISPGFWKFFGDVAIIFSFSGFGFFFISKYRKESKNVDKLFALMSFFVLIFFSLNFQNVFLIILAVLALYSLNFFLKVKKSTTIDFLFSSLFLSYIWFNFFFLVSNIGLIGDVFNPLVFAIISIIAGVFGIPGLVVISFLYQGYLILFQNLNVPGVSPFIPATNDAGDVGLSAPGTKIFIPIWYAILGLLTTVIFHETAHGILACAHKLKLKSTGVVLLGLLPIGAFVEPDEKQLEKEKNAIKKMRVFAVGSFSNFLVAIIAFTLMVISPILLGNYFSNGINILATQKGYPAEKVLERGMVIHSVNGIPTRTVEEFQNEMKKVKPGERVKFDTNFGKKELVTTENPDDPKLAYIGINLAAHTQNFIPEALFWIFFINFSISLVNLLPLMPLDGGRMLAELILTFNFNAVMKKKVMYGVIGFILLLIVVNILPLFNIGIDFLKGLV